MNTKALLIRMQNLLQVSHIMNDTQESFLQRLKMLDLRENKIAYLPPTVGNLHSLTVFLISHNHLKEVPSGMSSLSVRRYNISFCTELGACSELVHLDVQHNELVSLPETLGQLRKLSRLGLRYNKLQSLPATLAECVKFEEFIVESNHLTQLPVCFTFALSSEHMLSCRMAFSPV